jgi:hypothetical protein
MVEVFKTNVQEETHAVELIHLLLHHFPGTSINFDLEDCDKILRVKGQSYDSKRIILLLNQQGFTCNILDC